jgi:3-dehydroquinate dehydratase / shikimate dehydrogenase
MSSARICVPICETTWVAVETACRQASLVADLIELRLDYLSPDEFDLEKLRNLLLSLPHPLILTFRPLEQGGHREIASTERVLFWRALLESGLSTYWDVESNLLTQLSFAPDWSHVINSMHDFAGVPHDLSATAKEMAGSSAAVVKIAVHAEDITDCISIFRLIEDFRRQDRKIIAIAMGPAGVATRILGPSRGAFLTYGALDSESASAPGQLTAKQLRSVYHIDEITDQTPIFGLVGSPVMHSVSPQMHNASFKSENLAGVYLPFEVKDLSSFFRRMVNPQTRELDWNLGGLSVTAPHKRAVLDLVDSVAPDAREIGAINTVIIEDQKMTGYNTDVDGLLEPLRKRLGELAKLRVALIGSGGVARAAAWGLQREQAQVSIFARSSARSEEIAERFGATCQPIAGASFENFDVVINATPLGSFGALSNETPATREQLAGAKYAYDLVYNPLETRFLTEARIAGCQQVAGLEMLVAQARLQFELWTGQLPSSQVMFDAAYSVLR